MVENLKVVDMDTDNEDNSFDITEDIALVSDMKAVIADTRGVPYEDQILYFVSILLHGDERELSDFHIKSDMLFPILLHRKTKAQWIKVEVLCVWPYRRSFTADVSGLDCVASLKAIINGVVGVPPANQVLWAHGVEMRDRDAIRDYTYTQKLMVSMMVCGHFSPSRV